MRRAYGREIAQRGRLTVHHDTDTGPHQFNVVVSERSGKVTAAGSLAAAIGESEVLSLRHGEIAIALTQPEVDFLLDVQDEFDI